MTYTVQWRNDALRSGGYRGTFETVEGAREYLLSQVKRSRSFASFQVYTGNPRNPGSPVGFEFRGTAE